MTPETVRQLERYFQIAAKPDWTPTEEREFKQLSRVNSNLHFQHHTKCYLELQGKIYRLHLKLRRAQDDANNLLELIVAYLKELSLLANGEVRGNTKPIKRRK